MVEGVVSRSKVDIWQDPLEVAREISTKRALEGPVSWDSVSREETVRCVMDDCR